MTWHPLTEKIGTTEPRSTSVKVKSKAIPLAGRGGLLGCEMLGIAHCLDNRLTDGGKVVSPTHRPRSAPQKHDFFASGIHFCYTLSKPQGLVWPE
jgi:hypothetical protein